MAFKGAFADEATDQAFSQKISTALSDPDYYYKIEGLAGVADEAEGKTFSADVQAKFFSAVEDVFKLRASDDQSSFRDTNSLVALNLLVTAVYNSPLLDAAKKPVIYRYIEQIPLEQYIAQALTAATLDVQVRPLTLTINQAAGKTFLPFTQKMFLTALQQAFAKRFNDAKTALRSDDVINRFVQILRSSINAQFSLLDANQKQQVESMIPVIELEKSIAAVLLAATYTAKLDGMSTVVTQIAGKSLLADTSVFFFAILKTLIDGRLQQTPVVEITNKIGALLNSVSQGGLVGDAYKPSYQALLTSVSAEVALAGALQASDYMTMVNALAVVLKNYGAAQGNTFTQKYLMDIATNLFNNRTTQQNPAQIRTYLVALFKTCLDSTLIDATQKQSIQGALAMLASEDFVATLKQQFDARNKQNIDALKVLLATVKTALTNAVLVEAHKSVVQEMITSLEREINAVNLTPFVPGKPEDVVPGYSGYPEGFPIPPTAQIEFMKAMQYTFDNRKKQDAANLTRIKDLFSSVITDPKLNRFLNNQKTPQDQMMVQTWIIILKNEIAFLNLPKPGPGGFVPGDDIGTWIGGLGPDFIPTPEMQAYIMGELQKFFNQVKVSTDISVLNKCLQLFNFVVNSRFINNQKTPTDKSIVEGWIDYVNKRIVMLNSVIGLPTPVTPGNAGTWWTWWTNYTGPVTPELQILFMQQLQSLFEQLKNSSDLTTLKTFSQLLNLALNSKYLNNQKSPQDKVIVLDWIFVINSRIAELEGKPAPVPPITPDWPGAVKLPLTTEGKAQIMEQLKLYFEQLKDSSDLKVLNLFLTILQKALVSEYINNQKTPPDSFTVEIWIYAIKSQIAKLSGTQPPVPPIPTDFPGKLPEPMTREFQLSVMARLQAFFDQLKNSDDINTLNLFLTVLNKALVSNYINNLNTPPDSQIINGWIKYITERLDLLNKIKTQPPFNPGDPGESAKSFLEWLRQFGTPLPDAVQPEVYKWLTNLVNTRNRQDLTKLNVLLQILKIFTTNGMMTLPEYLAKINVPLIRDVTNDINFLSVGQEIQKFIGLTDFAAKLDALANIIAGATGKTIAEPIQKYFVAAVERMFTEHYGKPINLLTKFSQILDSIMKSPLINQKQQPQIQEDIDLLSMELAIYDMAQERDYSLQLDKLIFILDGALGLPFAPQVQDQFFKAFEIVYASRTAQYAAVTTQSAANLNKLDYIATNALSSTLLNDRNKQLVQDYPVCILVEQVIVDTKGLADYTARLNNLATVVRNYGFRMMSKITQDLNFEILKLVYDSRASQTQQSVTRLGQILTSMQASTLLNPTQQTEVRGWLAGMNITIPGLSLILQITQAAMQAVLATRISQLLAVVSSASGQTIPEVVQNVFASAVIQSISDAKGQDNQTLQLVKDFVAKVSASQLLSAAHKEYIKRAVLVLSGVIVEIAPVKPVSEDILALPSLVTSSDVTSAIANASSSTDAATKIDQLIRIVTEVKAGGQAVGVDAQNALAKQLIELANQIKSLTPDALVKLRQLLEGTMGSSLLNEQWKNYGQQTFIPTVEKAYTNATGKPITTAEVTKPVGEQSITPVVPGATTTTQTQAGQEAVQVASVTPAEIKAAVVEKDVAKTIEQIGVIVSQAWGKKLTPESSRELIGVVTLLAKDVKTIVKLDSVVQTKLGQLLSDTRASGILSDSDHAVLNGLIKNYKKAAKKDLPAPVKDVVTRTTTATTIATQPAATTEVSSITANDIKAAVVANDPAKTVDQMLLIVVRVWGQKLSPEASKVLSDSLAGLAKDTGSISQLTSTVQDKLGQLLANVKSGNVLGTTDATALTSLESNYKTATGKSLPEPSKSTVTATEIAKAPVTKAGGKSGRAKQAAVASSSVKAAGTRAPKVSAEAKGKPKKQAGEGSLSVASAASVTADKIAKANKEFLAANPATEFDKGLDAFGDFIKSKGKIPSIEQAGVVAKIGQFVAAHKSSSRDLNKLKSMLNKLRGLVDSKNGEEIQKMLTEVGKDLVKAK